MCGNAFVSSGATAAHMKAVHKILGPRAKPFEETKVKDKYNVTNQFVKEMSMNIVCDDAETYTNTFTQDNKKKLQQQLQLQEQQQQLQQVQVQQAQQPQLIQVEEVRHDILFVQWAWSISFCVKGAWQ